MPFGLVTAPQTFQMLMKMIFKGLTGKHCLVYIDDTTVLSDSFGNHLKHPNLFFFSKIRRRKLDIKTTQMCKTRGK